MQIPPKSTEISYSIIPSRFPNESWLNSYREMALWLSVRLVHFFYTDSLAHLYSGFLPVPGAARCGPCTPRERGCWLGFTRRRTAFTTAVSRQGLLRNGCHTLNRLLLAVMYNEPASCCRRAKNVCLTTFATMITVFDVNNYLFLYKHFKPDPKLRVPIPIWALLKLRLAIGHRL